MFNQVVEATRKVGDTGPGKQVTNKSTPSTSMRLGHELHGLFLFAHSSIVANELNWAK